MTGAFLQETRDIAQEWHVLLSELDRGRLHFRAEFTQALRGRVEAMRERMRRALETESAHEIPELGLSVGELLAASEVMPESTRHSEWRRFRRKMQPAYEAMAAALRDARIHVPTLRPTNYTRNAVHLGFALSSLVLLSLVQDWSILKIISLVFAVTAWTFELSRKYSPAVNRALMWFFGPIAHPHEAHRVNSSTWYATAILILLHVSSPPAIAVALAVLGIGDPLAALVGRKYGRIKLVHGRSLEGTAAFVLGGTCLSIGALLLLYPALGLSAVMVVALAGAVAGSLAELWSLRLDDNFTVPLAAWAAAEAALLLF